MVGVMRILSVMLVLCWMAGCASRPDSNVLNPVAAVPDSTAKVRLLVATTRERGDAPDPNAFTAGRSQALNYGALTVSIPNAHVPGEIEWPDQTGADPTTDFVTTDREFLDADAFLNEIRMRATGDGENEGSVLVFIHGYNTLYEEAVYWLAQIVHDSGFQGTAVLFAWPSQGKAPLYLADREASTYSRDYLETALIEMSRLPEVREINILAHSMGNWLAMETLRQASMKGHADFNGKLGDVILASPDLDVTVFRTQLDVIGNLPRPMTVLVSGDDKALGLSAWLAGGVERAGMLTASDARVLEGARRYNLRVVDLTAVDDGHGNHHSKYSKSGAVIAAIGQGLNSMDQKVQGGSVLAVGAEGSSLRLAPLTATSGR